MNSAVLKVSGACHTTAVAQPQAQPECARVACVAQGMYQEGVRTYAVRTEHIEDDMQGLMDWLCLPRLTEIPAAHTESYPRKNDTELSELGRARLAAHVIEDYYANSAVGVLADNLPSEADVAWAE